MTQQMVKVFIHYELTVPDEETAIRLARQEMHDAVHSMHTYGDGFGLEIKEERVNGDWSLVPSWLQERIAEELED